MVYHTSDEHLYDLTVHTTDTVSDETLVKLWISWSTLFATFGLVSFLVWMAIMLTPKVRSSPFNQYLLFLMFPDWFFTFSCAVTCAMNAANGSYWGFGMCQWQSWYCTFGIGANAWLNAVLAYEVHTMLKSSHLCQRYQPPTTRRVVRNSLVVYLLAGLAAAFGVLEIPFYPVDTVANTGITCFPKAFGARQMLVLWLVMMPLFVILPYAYVMYALFDIWRNRLMPPRGKRRLLIIYFFRIVAVFVFMWGPVAFFCFLLNDVIVPGEWELVVVYATCLLAHFQAFVSAVIAMTKPDIGACVKSLLTKIFCFSFWKRPLIAFTNTSSSFGFAAGSNLRSGGDLRSRQSFTCNDPSNSNRHSSENQGKQAPEPSSRRPTGFAHVEESIATFESIMEHWNDIPDQMEDFQFVDEKDEQDQNVQNDTDDINQTNRLEQVQENAPV